MPLKLIASAAVAAAACIATPALAALPADGATIDSITGLKGTWNAKESVFKVSKPRVYERIAQVRAAQAASRELAKSLSHRRFSRSTLPTQQNCRRSRCAASQSPQ